MYFTPNKMAVIKKTDWEQDKARVGKDVEKLQPAYIAGGSVKWFNYFGKQFDSLLKCFLKKFNTNLSYYKEISPLGICLREIKTHVHIKTYMIMFITALFILAKI